MKLIIKIYHPRLRMVIFNNCVCTGEKEREKRIIFSANCNFHSFNYEEKAGKASALRKAMLSSINFNLFDNIINEYAIIYSSLCSMNKVFV